jgi:hypothetical protein
VKRTSKHVRSAPSEPKEQQPDPTVHDTRSHLGFVGEGVRRSPKHKEQPASEAADEALPTAPVLGAGTSAIDVAAIRRSWASMIQTLRSQGKAVLPSFLETATPGSYDGETLELVFPPDRPFGVKKVTEREQELRAALQETFGIAPAIRCVLREGLDKVEVIEDDPPLSEEEALARIKAELGAQESES